MVQHFGDDIDNGNNKTTAKNAVEFINSSVNRDERRAQFKYWWINLAVCLGLSITIKVCPTAIYEQIKSDTCPLHLTFSFCVARMRRFADYVHFKNKKTIDDVPGHTR